MTFHRLVSSEDALFAEAFALYERSFPEHEQRFPEKQRALMGKEGYHFDVILDDGVFAGIILHWEFSWYTYIEHFAVSEAMRGKSLGSRILKAFCENRELVILEIDPPVDRISQRREGFYRRLGFQRNGYPHAHPAYRKKFSPHELAVLTYPRAIAKQEYHVFRRDLEERVMSDAPGS